ncbi:MAG: hypothetical protein IJ519_02370 [Clostridia bacterium]|nr:hypothetical protein [Clostridia bacterium]
MTKSLSAVFSSPLSLCRCIYATLCCVYYLLSFLMDLSIGESQAMVFVIFFACPMFLLPAVMIVTGGWIAYFAKKREKAFGVGSAMDILGRIAGCLMMAYIVVMCIFGCFTELFFLCIPLSVVGVSVIVCNIAVCVLEYRLRALSNGWEGINYSAKWLTAARVCAVISAVFYLGVSMLTKGDGSPLWCFAACITALQFCGIDPFTPVLLGRYKNEEKK